MGESRLNLKVLDLLGGAGQATMAVLGAYPRWVTGLQCSRSADIKGPCELARAMPTACGPVQGGSCQDAPSKKAPSCLPTGGELVLFPHGAQ